MIGVLFTLLRFRFRDFTLNLNERLWHIVQVISIGTEVKEAEIGSFMKVFFATRELLQKRSVESQHFG